MKFPKFSFSNEWKELKKFENLSESKRAIVFYAENKASMNHFRLLINELTEKEGIEICYVTSVKDDPIFSSNNQNILSFYIGDGVVRTKFFLTLKAKILIMDMPDLDTFHIKRSKMFPVHYVYIFHSMYSIHSYLRKNAIDNYDTIFCVGPHHVKEILQTEKVYGLKSKKLINYGFGRLDTLLQEKENFKKLKNVSDNLVLITPSYGENNLLEICGEKLIEVLLEANLKVVLRPHFRIIKDSPELINKLIKKFDKNENFILEKSIIPKEIFHSSTCLISDWSGISLEYAFTFERPVVFIDVPKKILNPDFGDIELEPIEISIRDKVGKVFSTDDLENIPEFIQNLGQNRELTAEKIKKIRSETVYNIGESTKIGVEYIKQLNNK